MSSINHFAPVGQKLASNLPRSKRHLSDYLIDYNYPDAFFFEPVTPSKIEYEISSIPINKPDGLYSCPIPILRCARHVISKLLAEIMHISFQTGVYPTKLKHAKDIPIYKNEDETDPGNYRPISLLSIFNRVFKKLM